MRAVLLLVSLFGVVVRPWWLGSFSPWNGRRRASISGRETAVIGEANRRPEKDDRAVPYWALCELTYPA